MSGGFFRGTSADQDTRFSNKQAKLLKSQKFAPELEHLVDMAKVKMDVMRPWIAKRVTEFVGIEDEVLINFIYGLLEGKDVNGKEIQIQLTGFMERNTGKFMKELWSLLLSAQNNASGVPQQFLDAKEEETRKKKVESDRVTNEIQRRKDREYEELEHEKRKAEDDISMSRDKYAGLEPSSKHHARHSPTPSAQKEDHADNNSKGRKRSSKSSHLDAHTPPRRDRRSRSISRSFSNSRSYSGEKHNSSREQRGRSISSDERKHHSPIKRSTSPRHKRSPRQSLSPPRRRRRSVSRSRLRSPSPRRYRRYSPLRRRSRSPLRRRSRSPMWRRSRSPMWRRSRSPLRHRSPSPAHRRTPYHMLHRSPSPFKRRSRHSPLSPRRGSPSAAHRPGSGRKVSRSPLRKRSRSPIARRSPSPEDSVSKSPERQRSLSPIKERAPRPERMSPVHSPLGRMRSRSPKKSNLNEKSEKIIPTRSVSPLRKQREYKLQHDTSERTFRSKSPDKSNLNERSEKRIPARSPSPLRKQREYKLQLDTSERSPDAKDAGISRRNVEQKFRSDETGRHHNGSGPRKRNEATRSEKAPERMDHIQDIDDERRRLHVNHPGSHLAIKNDRESLGLESAKANDEKNNIHPPQESKNLHESSREADDIKNAKVSGHGESDKRRYRAKEKRKHKRRSAKHDSSSSSSSDGDSSYDSGIDERKEAKRRKKEEKRLKKEEKRQQRREERRRRREERRVAKQKLKSYSDDVISGDAEKTTTNGGNVSEDADSAKKLEIELREKALESLRAKRGIGH
ncbi:unnamed protein product [Cuscuta europaea]|uniref:PWI domain-containing protein n=1 Tax=Cuscuta europaea TaxID=41803 RepID=A0A9P0Z938_CUSEU|nr:unnamed protein product [Cuscuta europaea]